jgi:hypothetical protein
MHEGQLTVDLPDPLRQGRIIQVVVEIGRDERQAQAIGVVVVGVDEQIVLKIKVDRPGLRGGSAGFGGQSCRGQQQREGCQSQPSARAAGEGFKVSTAAHLCHSCRWVPLLIVVCRAIFRQL